MRMFLRIRVFQRFIGHTCSIGGLYQEIQELVDIRKNEGLSSTSTVSVEAAQQGLYAAIIDDKVAVKIGPNNWSPSGGDWNVAASGNGYAVWTRGTVISPEEDWQRTVILVFGETNPGQDMFIRGGIDHGYAASALGLNCTASNYLCSMPIQHNNLLNDTTAAWKSNDNFLGLVRHRIGPK